MKTAYVKTNLRTVLNITKIVTIHYNEFDQSFLYPGEQHDFWEMVYVDKGKVEVCGGDKTSILEQGDIIFHAPNEFHSIKAYASSPNFFVLSFVCNSAAMAFFKKRRISLGKELRPFISAIIKEAEAAYVLTSNDTESKSLVKKQDAPIGCEQMIKSYLEQLLIMLLRSATNVRKAIAFPSGEELQHHLVVAVKQYVEDHVEERIRICDICDHLGYSKTYLSKLFREQCKDTIAGFITAKKIDRAKVLIREGRLNFSEISERLNFDNPQYFSRVFKRVARMSPSEFKHSLKRAAKKE